MAEIWQYVQIANYTFWGTDVYHVWFYVAILAIIVFAKSPVTKRVIGLYPIFFILALYSPIAYWFIKKYTSGIWQYFARLYSMIPLPVTIGFGTVLLIDFFCSRGKMGIELELQQQPKINNGSAALKLILTGGCCALMVFGGTNVYEQDWMKPAQNTNKVPDEAKAICQILHDDEGVTIAVPDSLSSYIRQIDASYIMPYGRYVNDLGAELSKEHPDPVYVMEEAGREACDYVVTYSNDLNRAAFADKGWMPYDEINNYIIYQVQKVTRVKNVYDKYHTVIMRTILDEFNNTVKASAGYTSVSYEYDKYGNLIIEKYLDEEGNLFQLETGYASVHRTYTSPFSKVIKSVRYEDRNGNQICFRGRYETKYEYDEMGRVKQESFFDVNGQPMERCKLGYASRIINYGTDGSILAEYYFDVSGKAKETILGYASYSHQKNQNGEIIGEEYYDEKGTLIGYTNEKNHSIRRNVFQFFHISDGVDIQDNKISMTTTIPNNQFNMIHFQLFNSKGEYVSDFGRASSIGSVDGEYHHELSDGIYKIRFKGNTNLADESMYTFLYLRKGDYIIYHYELSDIQTNLITIDGLNVLVL